MIAAFDRALAKRAEWMREQAAKQLEVELAEYSFMNEDKRHGSNLAVTNGAKLIRALPLAPGGDDEA